jgi:septum formation protein
VTGTGLQTPLTSTTTESGAYQFPSVPIGTYSVTFELQGFKKTVRNEILITSDTLVLCGDRVMGKPYSREDAIDMIRCLSDKNHKVITAITLRDKDRCQTLSDTAFVHFKALSDSEIEYYVDTYKPFDKAGAYGIQEWIGYIGIDKIEGSYFTIMGLPVHLVYQELVKFIG